MWGDHLAPRLELAVFRSLNKVIIKELSHRQRTIHFWHFIGAKQRFTLAFCGYSKIFIPTSFINLYRNKETFIFLIKCSGINAHIFIKLGKLQEQNYKCFKIHAQYYHFKLICSADFLLLKSSWSEDDRETVDGWQNAPILSLAVRVIGIKFPGCEYSF